MQLVIQVVIGLIVALGIYNLIHYYFVTCPTKKRQENYQSVVDAAVKFAISELEKDNQIAVNQSTDINSELIADVWGRGVMAFEYNISLNELNVVKNEFRISLKAALDEYSVNHKMTTDISRESKNSVFMITDLWVLNNEIHFDVAYLVNQTTAEYIADLKRLK